MGYICAVKGCSNKSSNKKGDSRIQFFRFPAIRKNRGDKFHKLCEDRRRQWIANIRRKDLDDKKAENSRVCSKHFISGEPASTWDNTNPDWAPTQNLGHQDIGDVSLAVDRNDRAQSRKRRRQEMAVHSHDESSQVETTTMTYQEFEVPEPTNMCMNTSASELDKDCQTEPVSTRDQACQTDIDLNQMEKEKTYLEHLLEELANLKSQLLSVQLSQETFKENDEKTKFYTGLPNYNTLMSVFNLTSPCIKRNSQNALEPFSEFILVLLRLKLNLPLQELAYRFNVSLATASRIFDRWIHALSVRLQFLIHWPEREELQATMPAVFQRNFGKKVSVIIDCFEIFIDRPSSLIARAMTWSNYKHHNTIKFLIGITPQGVISFISKAWGGRVSDKHLTQHSAILRKLLPGDIVLADRGFDIEDSVGFYQAKLHIPAFTKGKKQLSAVEVEDTRKIANVRIHVERVIGHVRRKYSIMQGILPVQLVTSRQGDDLAPIDKIAIICCALTNLSESIVPFQ